MSRSALALLVFGTAGALVVGVAGVRKWLVPTLPTESAALWISVASLAISIITFYLLEIRGPDITIHELEREARYKKDLSTWIADGSFRAVIECRLLVANEGRKAGVVQKLVFGVPTFAPHQPRALRALAHPPHDENGNEIRAPFVLQDGALLSAVVAIDLVVDRDRDFQQRCAYDLRELDSVSVPFIYAFTSHGSLRQRRGLATVPLEEVRRAVLESWRDMPDARTGFRILSEETAT